MLYLLFSLESRPYFEEAIMISRQKNEYIYPNPALSLCDLGYKHVSLCFFIL